MTVPPDDPNPIILPSAHKHGVQELDMLHALRYSLRHYKLDDDLAMFIGPDRTGQMIEVGAIAWWGGELTIIHAMSPARNKFLR